MTAKVFDPDTIVIEHFMTKAQLDAMFPHVAKPVDHHGEVDWIGPSWWYLAYAMAKS